METTRHNVLLRAGDFDLLKASYPKVSATAVIRQLVARHVDALKAKHLEGKQNVDARIV